MTFKDVHMTLIAFELLVSWELPSAGCSQKNSLNLVWESTLFIVLIFKSSQSLVYLKRGLKTPGICNVMNLTDHSVRQGETHLLIEVKATKLC